MQGATPCAVVAAPAAPFRSAPPCRGRPTRRDAPRGPPCFDPRPHAGGDHRVGPGRRQQQRFDPRPHAGGDIHAPLRRHLIVVSIRAPMQGATARSSPARTHRSRFDPRPHAGGDATCRRPRASQLVSIRAPMQGATPPAEPHISTSTFRSAPPCRGRLIARSVYQAIRLFRSAPPCRGRPPAHQVRAAPGRFDPRPHAGGDGLYINTGAPDGQFRSAPPCRGRPAPRSGGRASRGVSIRAPMQGATGCCRLIGRHVGVSIHAPMQGATRR